MKKASIIEPFRALFTGIICIFAFSGPAQEQAQAQVPTNPPVSLEKKEILTAEKVKTSLETTVVDSMMLQLETLEDELYPAADLYDNWNTEYVRAYKDAVIPDSFLINVSEFVMPVATIQRVTSPYGPRRRRFHYGTDLKVQVGDTIYAAFDGKVRIKSYERRGYGYYLVLRHPNGLETVYGHLSKFIAEQDENVKAGQPIALGGNSGRSTGSHLHFEFRFLGNPINPAEIIDFGEWAIKDDQYTFVKNKSGNSYGSASKYMAGSGKINYHRIRSGDTLSAIARRYGTTVTKLCRLNNMKDTAVLQIGRSIRIS
jgi:murein DD-endopeptidase MepM/ murein hydrolase activator NlpD